MQRPILLLASSALLALPLSAQKAFREVGQAVGIVHEHTDGFDTASMGGGLAWLDLDADGDDDLFAASSDGFHSLFRNDGGVFTDVTAGSGVAPLTGSENMGAIAADFDADGRCDLYLTNKGPNALLRNRPDGTLLDVGGRLRVAGDGWSSSASFADFDGDGDLDLYVGNYVGVGYFPWHIGTPNDFYENRSELGQETPFAERAAELGVDGGTVFDDEPSLPYLDFYPAYPDGHVTAGCTLSVCTLDYDEDGDPDLFSGNDFGPFVLPDQMWRNDSAGGGMAFTDVTAQTGFDERPLYNMGINPCDYDHDGDWDFYLSNFGDNVLLRNDGGVFTDVTYDLGPISGLDRNGKQLVSWGTVWGDFDNDGFEDLFVANGYVPSAFFLPNDEQQANHLWMSRDGRFERVPDAVSGIADVVGVARGVGHADFDGNGLLDFAVQNTGGLIPSSPGFARLFANTGALGDPANHWIEMRLVGDPTNREAIGARVEVRAGPLLLKRQVLGDPIYLSSPTRLLHFGLGDVDRVDRVVVHWPDETVQVLYDLEAGRLHVVQKPALSAVRSEHGHEHDHEGKGGR